MPRSPFIITLICLLLLGCTKNDEHGATKDSIESSSANKQALGENAGKVLPFEESLLFTENERKAATATREYLEASHKEKFDARYVVTANDKGWLVTVYYVGGYLPTGRPNFAPGRSAEYQVSLETWKVEPGEPGL